MMSQLLYFRKIIILVLLLFPCSLFSQKDTSQCYNKTLSNNNFSVELGGKGGYYSIGYERTVYKSRRFLLSTCINLNYGSIATPNIGLVLLPWGLNILLGKKQNKLFFGLYEINAFNFIPYPKTRKKRRAFIDANRNTHEIQKYQPPFELPWIVPSIGYRRYFRKGNSLSITFSPLLIIYADGVYNIEHPALSPWIGVNYNFKF